MLSSFLHLMVCVECCINLLKSSFSFLSSFFSDRTFSNAPFKHWWLRVGARQPSHCQSSVDSSLSIVCSATAVHSLHQVYPDHRWNHHTSLMRWSTWLHLRSQVYLALLSLSHKRTNRSLDTVSSMVTCFGNCLFVFTLSFNVLKAHDATLTSRTYHPSLSHLGESLFLHYCSMLATDACFSAATSPNRKHSGEADTITDSKGWSLVLL